MSHTDPNVPDDQEDTALPLTQAEAVLYVADVQSIKDLLASTAASHGLALADSLIHELAISVLCSQWLADYAQDSAEAFARSQSAEDTDTDLDAALETSRTP